MSDQRDFFISFTGADQEIATAINDALNDAGFTTWFHPKDKPKGAGIADWMEVALDASTQMIAICSDAYFDRSKGYSRAERQSMFWEDPTNNQPLLILVKVEDCTFPRLIAQNEYISLTGMQRPEAALRLVAELQGEQARKARLAAEDIARDRRPPAVFNVPGQPNRYFTGRDTEMDRLHERIKSGTATAITAVKGMGGIGKTTLAREYALKYGLATRFGGVWWIDADSEPGILNAYEKLADHPGTDIEKGEDLPGTAENARDWLARQPSSAPWLVIFDNAVTPEEVAPWLPGGTAQVILTTRKDGFEVLAEPMSLDKWDEDTTVAFLSDRIVRGTPEELASLAQRLDGLPLAAEQAGAYLALNCVSFAAYEAKLIEMLKKKPASLPGSYPDSLFATFSAAIEALAEHEHGAAALGILNLCAYLSPDGVEVAMLAACAEATDILPDPPRAALADELARGEAIGVLTGYSLMRMGEPDEWGDRLVLHRLLAEVARARLEASEAECWSGAAVIMVRKAFPPASQGGKGDPSADPSVWPICARLVLHAQALQTLSPGPGPVGEALGFVLNQAAVYLYARGDIDGAVGMLRSCVVLTEAVFGEESQQLPAALGNLAWHLGELEATWDEAEAVYTRALKIKEAVLQPGDPSLAITLSNLGGLHWRRKDFARAEELIGRAAKIDKAAHGETSTQYAIGLNNLGAVYRDWAQATGDPDLHSKAREVTEQDVAITRAQRGPRHPEMATSFSNLGATYFYAGVLARAAEEMAQAVAVFLSLDLQTHPNCQTRIATLLHFWTESGQTDKADRLRAGDGSDIFPIVEAIEKEHRAWVAEDPENRDFGPPSPVTGAWE